jgi:hypothetical protein
MRYFIYFHIKGVQQLRISCKESYCPWDGTGGALKVLLADSFYVPLFLNACLSPYKLGTYRCIQLYIAVNCMEEFASPLGAYRLHNGNVNVF